MHTIDSFPGREIILNDKPYLYFGGTAYLGLQTDIEFQHLFIENIKKYGTNYGASRKSNVRIAIFDKAEEYLAQLVGSEACVTMSSGYLAGQFIGQFLNNTSNKFFYSPNTHSALYISNQIKNKPKSYITFTALNIAIRDHLEKNDTIPVVFLDSIDFSGANFPDFEGLKALPLEEVILVVDDSHGIGITGENGGGVFRKIQKLNPKELIVCCSLGKGFGVQGGAVFGSKERILSLVNTDFFGGSSPASPANLASIYYGESIYRKKRKLLQLNTAYFIENIENISFFKYMVGHPAFTFSSEKLTHLLEQNGILVTSFRYPSEDGDLMSRIVISAAHTKKDLERICNIIISYF